MWRMTTQDDRGRPVRLVRFGPSSRRGLWRLAASRPVLGVGVIAALITTVALGILHNGPAAIWLTLFTPVASLLILTLVRSGAAVGRSIEDRPERVRAAMIRIGRCPSCRYALGGLSPADDGCTVCPECAAAWAMSSPRYAEAGEPVIVPDART